MNWGMFTVVVGGIILLAFLLWVRAYAKELAKKPLSKKEQRRRKRNGI